MISEGALGKPVENPSSTVATAKMMEKRREEMEAKRKAEEARKKEDEERRIRQNRV